jgi:tRNA threonylcarbamoyladenosine modification (KEOPS) complex Cgi121 subunit
MEVLLFISGSRQINEALRRVGVTVDTRQTGALTVGSSNDLVLKAGSFVTEALGRRSSDDLLDHWTSLRIENVRLGFGIADKELKAITRKRESVASAIERLAIERSAMLAVRK